ncbi:MAG TPA: tetratricopeptide repeat protein, partial [Bacteroidia bacterium]|nr:tetratricopeptide repeat protein [Bacteroidia bacterium]
MQSQKPLSAEEHNLQQKKRLQFVLENRQTPAIVFIQFDKLPLRDELISQMQRDFVQYQHHVLDLTANPITSLARSLKEKLPQKILNSHPATCMVHVKALENSFLLSRQDNTETSALITEINFEREILFHQFPFVMVIWTTEVFITTLQKEAMDFWSWVVYYYSFNTTGTLIPVTKPIYAEERKQLTAEQQQTIEELSNALASLTLNKLPTERELREQLNLYMQLAKNYNDVFYYDMAIAAYENALAIAGKFEKEEYEILTRLYNQMGLTWLDKGNADLARECFEKSLAIDKKYNGEEHPNIAAYYNNLGSAYGNKGEYDKAIDYYQKALFIDKKYHGEEHPKIATYYNNLGGAYDNKGEYDNSIDCYQMALAIDKKFYGEEHPSIAIDYNNLGETYRNKGEYDKAIDYYQKALVIDKKYHGEEHPKIAIRYNNLGSAYHNKGEYDKAI